MLISKITRIQGKVVVIALVILSVVPGNVGTAVVEDNQVDLDPYKLIGTSSRKYSDRQIFDFRRNGIRVDVRVVPAPRNSSTKNDDGFPEFPTKDIGRCIVDLSFACAKNRFGRFVRAIGELNEIYLMGQEIKLVKTRAIGDRGSNDSNYSIDRGVNDFFDAFALRITLPRWNGKREKNQIDVTFEETAVSEGRGKKGSGGGGKGGGKCKMMMMAGLMMLKLKLIGVATLKGMMMSGMSFMLSMAMLMQKYIKGGGGGGGHGGGGGQYKEIVLLTKSSGGGGGGGGGGGCCPPSDNYGAPPASSYGPPFGGGGGGGGGGYGGGWGRSFGRRFSIDRENIDYQNYGNANWNLSNYGQQQGYSSINGSNLGNNSNAEPLLRSESINYSTDTNSYRNADSKDNILGSSSINGYVNDVNHVRSTSDVVNANTARPIYIDEWQATEEKVLPLNLRSGESGENSKIGDDSPLRRI